MKIVTLTTDLGLKDQYVASLKGLLLSKISDIQIVDVSHQVDPFNIAQASYFINNIFEDFPAETIHFIGVDSIPYISIDSPKENNYPIVMKLKNQYFVGCDNGFFSLLPDYQEAEFIVRLDFSSKNSIKHPIRNIYIPAIIALLNNEDIMTLGEKADTVRRAMLTQAITEENTIRGTVIHVDHYGNCIVNVTEKLFKQVGKGHPFTIFFRKSSYFIERISENYNEVTPGEKLALFNENSYLEIAINKGVQGMGGGASSLLGLNKGDIVRIEFMPKGSKETIESLFH